ncbi:polysaccharide biosynthesis/export family protein [Aurantiacibacter sp. D1-12]|uniref:polysaccharide biosynthesis/export family protein n=1 Tax=Aurantiacibacter sp. D1-12 TaxID=2993658 RepID=UPI00237CD4E9|nr:polysaccharide biosynthesis/export family protein [Aurantiacibacter sp. D1-12]MDE1467465.1 polysaccharide export protein [Aurantiacibacter sp. D1-12]
MGQEGYSQTPAVDHAVRAGDELRVTVFREEALSLESVIVSADGTISLPLVGPYQAAGKTMAQIETEIEAILGERYLLRPDVAVNILDYGSHLVTVEGQVTEPGVFQFAPGTRLSGGISLANGLTRVADRRDVAVFRQTAEGLQVARFDYAAVSAGRMIDPVLQPGDRIVVGTDGLAQFYQDALRAVPVLGIFTNAGI